MFQTNDVCTSMADYAMDLSADERETSNVSVGSIGNIVASCDV